MNGGKEFEQFFAIAFVFLQGMTEGDMFGLPLSVKTGGISGHKGKGIIVVFIFHEMEEHLAHEMGVRAVGPDKILDRTLVRLKGNGEGLIKSFPHRLEHLSRQVFGTCHEGGTLQVPLQVILFYWNPGFMPKSFQVRGQA